MEHRKKVDIVDKAQAVVAISRSQGTMESKAREFHRERSQSFARISCR